MFNNLITLINKETEERKNNLRGYICNPDNTDALRRESTETRWNQFIEGIIDRATANDFAMKRAFKAIDKTTTETMEKVDRVLNAPDLVSVKLYITWSKSKAWGYNPTVEATADTNDCIYSSHGTASGCGYDKESAAVAQALNKINSVLKALYKTKEAVLSIDPTVSSHKALNYGAGYGVLPYFEGGVGMGSLIGVFKACGFTLAHESHGEHQDYYYFKRA